MSLSREEIETIRLTSHLGIANGDVTRLCDQAERAIQDADLLKRAMAMIEKLCDESFRRVANTPNYYAAQELLKEWRSRPQ